MASPLGDSHGASGQVCSSLLLVASSCDQLGLVLDIHIDVAGTVGHRELRLARQRDAGDHRLLAGSITLAVWLWPLKVST